MEAVGAELKSKRTDVPEKEGDRCVAITVLFFARARDITGLTDMTLNVAVGSTVKDCLDALTARFPNLEEIQDCMVLALNEEYRTDSTVVKENDELAIIPPISGG